jgi:TM2 domain-containing membrane protein YozV
MSESLSLTEQSELGPPPQKSAGLAFVLSLLLPGIGQIYCGKIRRGIWTLVLSMLCAGGFVFLAVTAEGQNGENKELFAGMLLRTAIVLYGFGFIDAFMTAREVSSGRDRNIVYNPRVAAVLNLTTRGFGYYYVDEKKRAVLFFMLVGVLARVNSKIENIWVDLALEFMLIGLAVDAYRMAVKLNPPAEPVTLPYREERRDVLAGLVYGLGVLLVVGYFSLSIWGWVAPDFSKIDQTQANFETRNGQTIYRNAKYGVTIHLPGNWTHSEAEKSHFFVMQDSENGLHILATAESLFPTDTVEKYEAQMLEGLLSTGTYTLLKSEPIRMGELSARRLTLRQKDEDGEALQAIVLAKKGLAVYIFILSATSEHAKEWERTAEKLHESIELR